MRVLLLVPMADGQTDPAIKYAFEQLGHAVVAVDAKRAPGKSYEVSLQVKPELVFCSRTKGLTEQVALIKRTFKNAIICMWNVDSREDIGRWKRLYPLIKLSHYHFVVTHNQLPQWKQINPRTFWLPQGLQSELYRKPHEITKEDRAKYTCEVCFCGRMDKHHAYRISFINAVKAMRVRFKLWNNRRIWGEEHNKMVALSKINLGCSGWIGATRSVSVRSYKILGAGGFLMERYRPGINELFPMNDSDRILDCYNSPQELVDKIRYWLEHEQERKEIAKRGYAWVHSTATYTHRMRMALGYMKEILPC